MVTQNLWDQLWRDMVTAPFDVDGDGCWVSVGPETVRLVIPHDEDEEDEPEYHCYTIGDLRIAYDSGDEYARRAVDLLDAYYYQNS